MFALLKTQEVNIYNATHTHTYINMIMHCNGGRRDGVVAKTQLCALQFEIESSENIQ